MPDSYTTERRCAECLILSCVSSIDFAMLADRFIFRLKLLVFPYIREPQNLGGSLLEQSTRFVCVESPLTFQLVLECGCVVLIELRIN